MKKKNKGILKFLKSLGPGFVTGTADNDPSGIATCSQIGAKFGYGLLWTSLYTLPMMIAVQETCARIGTCKGKGLTHTISHFYSRKIAAIMVLLLLIANIINIGADIGSMAAATQLLIPLNFTVLVCLFVFVMIAAQIYIGYKKYAALLKWICLSMFAYPLTVIIINAPFSEILPATLIPHMQFDYNFLFLVTGMFGTTISPYLFFWQASQETEEDRAHHRIKKSGDVCIKRSDIKNMQTDNLIGMVMSQITSWAIIVVAGTVLHAHHITDVKTAADAAKMLEPLVKNYHHAGLMAKIIFSSGIIGLGLVAVPVLSGSCAYAVCELFQWRAGINLKFKPGKKFYSIIILVTVLGAVLNYIGIDPIKALLYAAVVNGILAIPMIFLITLIGRNEKILGEYKSSRVSQFFMWVTFICMLLSALGMMFAH